MKFLDRLGKEYANIVVSGIKDVKGLQLKLGTQLKLENSFT